MAVSERYRSVRENGNTMEEIESHDYMIFSCRDINKKGIAPSFITDYSSQKIEIRKGYTNYIVLVFSHFTHKTEKKEEEAIPLPYWLIDISNLDIPGVFIVDKFDKENYISLYKVEDAIFKKFFLIDSKLTKKDTSVRKNGNLSHFQFFGHRFELSNRTAFYDWLYINALLQNPVLCEEIMRYRAFADIEFNSQKSMNTQECAIALYISLRLDDIDMSVLKDPDSFIKVTFPFYNKFI
jgi:hypothetical protein